MTIRIFLILVQCIPAMVVFAQGGGYLGAQVSMQGHVSIGGASQCSDRLGVGGSVRYGRTVETIDRTITSHTLSMTYPESTSKESFWIVPFARYDFVKKSRLAVYAQLGLPVGRTMVKVDKPIVGFNEEDTDRMLTTYGATLGCGASWRFGSNFEVVAGIDPFKAGIEDQDKGEGTSSANFDLGPKALFFGLNRHF